MSGVVCVPFRPGDERREIIWEFLRAHWERAGFTIFAADCDDERFGVARARNLAAVQAGDWDVALFADADVFVPTREAHAALTAAADSGGYVAAYQTLHWLSPEATDRVLAGEHPTPSFAGESQRGCWLNAFAIGRELWDKLRGFDESRFLGIGGEDVNLFARMTEVSEPSRVAGDCYHLHHPPRESRWT